MILLVVFVVLMLFWLFFGWYTSDPANPKGLGGTLIPWVCVAILGWVVFNGAAVGPLR